MRAARRIGAWRRGDVSRVTAARVPPNGAWIVARLQRSSPHLRASILERQSASWKARQVGSTSMAVGVPNVKQ
jgi:hypothetical protein